MNIRAFAAAGVAASLALAAGVLTFDTASAAPITELGTRRALCTKVGTGELRDLWLTADGKCQAGYNFADTKALGIGGGSGTVGPKGDKGDKGEPGTGGLWFRTATVKLSAASPATQTVTITGVPAKSALSVESPAPLTNLGSVPGTAKVTVIPLAVSAGSTERAFTVTTEGLTEPFTLTVEVFGAVLAAS